MIHHALHAEGTMTLTGGAGTATSSVNVSDCRGKEMSQLIIDPSSAITYDISILDENNREVWRREDHTGDFNETGCELPLLAAYTLKVENGSATTDVYYRLVIRESA